MRARAMLERIDDDDVWLTPNARSRQPADRAMIGTEKPPGMVTGGRFDFDREYIVMALWASL